LGLRRVTGFLMAVGFVCFGTTAFATVTIQAKGDHTKVFLQASSGSPVISELSSGQVLQAGNVPVQGFRKVLVTVGNSKKIGFVSVNDVVLKGSNPRSSSAPYKRGRSAFDKTGRRMGVGLMLGGNYQTQGAQVVGNVTLSSVSGSGFIFGGVFSYPLLTKMTLEGEVFYKSTTATGTASDPLRNPGGATSTFNQSFLSFGALGQFFLFQSLPHLWLGPGLQIDYGMSETWQYGVYTQSPSASTFIEVYGAAGWDFMIHEKWKVSPQIRVGVFNSSPMLIEVDGIISGTYLF
jgi:hypothetical protein